MKQLTLKSNVIISDPCYSKDTWCQHQVDNVQPGVYTAFVNIIDAKEWGQRVARLVIFHESLTIQQVSCEEELGEIGVDSGQAGFFSEESYRNDTVAQTIITPPGSWIELSGDFAEGDAWYDKMCAFTINAPEKFGVYSEGVVARSGFGDGIYPVYVQYDSLGMIVAMEIEFISSQDLEEINNAVDDTETI